MNIKIDFDGSNFIAGFIFGAVLFYGLSLWWLLLSLIVLLDFEIKGMPYIKFKYDSTNGFRVEKGRYV